MKKCPACGTEVNINSKYCNVCSKNLLEEYQPLDLLRSSYNLHGRKLTDEKVESLFEQNKNSASETAFACFVYSLVPYLGILFVPAALLAGGYGVIISLIKPDLGGKKLSIFSFISSLIVLFIQFFLWWLLYLIPKLSKL